MRGAASLFSVDYAPDDIAMQCYVDDPIVLAKGDKDTRRRLLSMVILWFLLFGLRMSWQKVSRGLRVNWCGATISFPDK